jgi:hypothetical protein
MSSNPGDLFPFDIIIHPDARNSSKVKLSVTGRGGLQGYDMLRITHCLDTRLIDGGEVVSLTHQSCFTPQKHNFSALGTHFC